MKLFPDAYLPNRFFYLFAGVIAGFVLAFFFPLLFPAVQTLGVLGLAAVGLDVWLLFGRALPLTAERQLPKVLSLGEEMEVRIAVENASRLPVSVELIDELPVQLQERALARQIFLKEGERKRVHYQIRPTERGSYQFGDLLLFVRSPLRLVERRIRIPQKTELPVYPSIIQMKRFELEAFDATAHEQGVKKLRRLGHSYEFEQIKNYVKGDDYRSINWKASSRRAALMVNQYEDERSQQVYCIIDKSRAMRMPFQELTLMDHAINTCLVTTNIILRKYDKAGLLTFSEKMGTFIKADRRSHQMSKILQALYKEEERSLESNYELLFFAVRKLIARRSLLLLFTNFESRHALERAMPVLRKINRFHLLVVVFFKNTEIEDFAYGRVRNVEGIYQQATAQHFVLEKERMVQQLRQYGIQVVLTRPEELSVNTVNKYLELKSRGMI